ncbi:MAG: amidohydrolase [Verrucomicrobiales bacterium]|nr:amidohydrolase [Verrucomicrobiales bacterium]
MKLLNHIALSTVIFFAFSTIAGAQTSSLQDLSGAVNSAPEAVIFTAKEIVTLDPAKPTAEAVAVVGERILATGTVAELKAAAGDQPFRVDDTFKDHVIIPGLIGQHDHPVLTALTMVTQIIAIEDWTLPSGVVTAANNREEYIQRITEAEASIEDPKEPLITWGFHHYFHGKLTRADLNELSMERPIVVWHRSCHEFILNDPALALAGIDEAFLSKQSESGRAQSNLAEGHFWEQGMFGILPQLAPVIATPEKLKEGLDFMIDFFHAAGVTMGCEPGGVLSRPLQEAQNAVLSGSENPFRFYYIPDGKSIAGAYPDAIIAETEKLMEWGEGMTAMVPKQVKLFADGAIYSQLMQLKEPYTDGHEGEWMMDLDFFRSTFRTYWDANYQIHIHVNGDAGLEMVLNTLEENMRRYPRHDHRTVIVHFAVSTADQVERIGRLGAIVSANSYYPVALADNYSKSGLGPERADPMARMGDVEKAGISYSFHSDMPMAPGQPLFLMHCGVNRITQSGRVAAPEQRVSREGALKAVTLEAAYSLQMENEVGSIEPGKLANFTILGDNPVTCEPTKIKDIPVWGTVSEGRILPVRQDSRSLAFAAPKPSPAPLVADVEDSVQQPRIHPAAKRLLSAKSPPVRSCTCSLGKRIAEILIAASLK